MQLNEIDSSPSFTSQHRTVQLDLKKLPSMISHLNIVAFRLPVTRPLTEVDMGYLGTLVN